MSAPAFNVGSAAAAAIAPSGIRAVADLAWRTPGTLQLQLGEPSHPTPPHVVEALAQAARDGATRYGPTPGVPAFREAAAAKVYDEFALRLGEFMGASRNPDVLAECVAASRHVMAREYYKHTCN